MREPSLSCGPATPDEVYRFLWLRSFHHAMAVRVSRVGEAYTLNAIVLSGAGGYEPGVPLRRVHRNLSASEWERVSQALRDLGFWTKSAEPPPDEELVGMDGAQWIIEGRRERYRVVDRWNGEDGVRQVGLLFLDLAGIRPRENEVY